MVAAHWPLKGQKWSVANDQNIKRGKVDAGTWADRGRHNRKRYLCDFYFRPVRKAEEEARFKVDFEARTGGTALTGAKASSTTKGIDLERWKARGGIVVD